MHWFLDRKYPGRHVWQISKEVKTAQLRTVVDRQTVWTIIGLVVGRMFVEYHTDRVDAELKEAK
jgi:hypothetical protein